MTLLNERVTPTARVLEYDILLETPKAYPRIHIIAMKSLLRPYATTVKVDVHVDYEKHHTDCFHPAVDKIYATLHNI